MFATFNYSGDKPCQLICIEMFYWGQGFGYKNIISSFDKKVTFNDK